MSPATPATVSAPDRPATHGESGRRRAAARRARSVVLTSLAIFALLGLGAGVLLEHWLPEVVDPDYYTRVRYFRHESPARHGEVPTVLMLGSSRSYSDLDGVLLERLLSEELGRPVSFVNFGIPGRGFVYELLTWKRLRRDGISPDLLLIEVLPALFLGDQPWQLSEELLPAGRLTSSDLEVLERYRADTRPHLRRDLALSKANALYDRRSALLHAVTPWLMPPREPGRDPIVWELNRSLYPSDVPSSEQRARALAVAYREYGDYLRHHEPRRCEALDELLRSSRAAGIPAVLVVMPEGPVYRSWYAPETREKIQNWLDATSREADVEVIDARTWIDEDDFFDSHHMLPSGAAKFSERFGREQLLPRLQRLAEPQQLRASARP